MIKDQLIELAKKGTKISEIEEPTLFDYLQGNSLISKFDDLAREAEENGELTEDEIHEICRKYAPTNAK